MKLLRARILSWNGIIRFFILVYHVFLALALAKLIWALRETIYSLDMKLSLWENGKCLIGPEPFSALVETISVVGVMAKAAILLGGAVCFLLPIRWLSKFVLAEIALWFLGLIILALVVLQHFSYRWVLL